MPCFSKIETVLLDLAVIQRAADLLGITVTKRRPNAYTLSKNGEHINIERSAEGQKFSTVSFSGSDNWPTEIINPLVQAYAKEQVKSFAKKKGYTVSAGSKPGEIILTQYTS